MSGVCSTCATSAAAERRVTGAGGTRAGKNRSTRPATGRSRPRPDSSPRGRGTLGGARDRIRDPRFIPAQAGNATPATASTGPRPVHPRAGGERVLEVRSHLAELGSSPRGRGTPSYSTLVPRRARFIPARAGNAISTRRRAGEASVHPRAGGERRDSERATFPYVGSSPRGRGTHRIGAAVSPVDRFIPARAGNASSCNILIQNIFFGANEPTRISASEKRMAQVSRTAP